MGATTQSASAAVATIDRRGKDPQLRQKEEAFNDAGGFSGPRVVELYHCLPDGPAHFVPGRP